MTNSRTTSLKIGNYTLDREVLSDLTKLRRPFPKVAEVEGRGDKLLATTRQAKLPKALKKRRVSEFPIPNWPDEREMTYHWTLHAQESNPQTGYDGALLSAEVNGQKHYFIYSLCSNDTGDVGTIGLMLNGHRPEQVLNAQQFSDACIRKIRARHPGEDVPIVHVGYSLGGALTELVNKQGRPAIVFDSPPVSAVQDQEAVPQAKRDEALLSVVGPHDAIFNSHGRHNGQILVAGEKFWQTNHVSFDDFWRMNEANHELSVLGKALDAMPEWKTFPSQQWNRATHLIDAFVDYLDANTEGRKPALDEDILIKKVKKMQTAQGKQDAEKVASFIFDAVAQVVGARKANEIGVLQSAPKASVRTAQGKHTKQLAVDRLAPPVTRGL